MADQKINIIDLLSSTKSTDKISKISQVVVDKSLSDLQKKFFKEIDGIGKRLDDLEKVNITDEVSKAIAKGEDELRSIIQDEIASIFFRLYVKRNTWK